MITDNTIYSYRKKKPISQQALADLLDIPRTTMSFYENKRMYPTHEMAEKIAEILNTTIGKLYDQNELDIIRSNK